MIWQNANLIVVSDALEGARQMLNNPYILNPERLWPSRETLLPALGHHDSKCLTSDLGNYMNE
jgi:hypothetical protein